MKKNLLFASSLLFLTNASAQTQGVSYTAVGKGVSTTFVTDYHSLGINSSNLGWKNRYGKKVTMGMTEFNVGFYSDSLNSDKLKDLYKAIRTDLKGEDASANWEQQKGYAADYLEAGVLFDANYNWFGISFQDEKIGGFAFSINEGYSWYSKFNEETTGLIFGGRASDYFDQLTVVFGADTSVIANTGNLSQDTLDNVILGTMSVPLKISEITKDSEVRFAWNRYYNFGYGRKIFGNDSTFALYGGIGGRFIQSMAMLNMESDGETVNIYSSYSSGFDLDYGSIAKSNPSNFTGSGILPKPVGMGYGLDFSASVQMLGFLKIGAAVNNIGSVTYSRNVYRVKDSLVGDMSLEGLQNENITNSANQFLEDGGILTLVGEEEYVLQNAATVRLGASIDIGEIASLGVDVVAPFDKDRPGSIVNPVFSIGGEIRPLKWLCLSAGYYGGGLYQHNIPVGINFILGGGTYEFGVSSRDALSFFLDNANSISAAFGFARVRF